MKAVVFGFALDLAIGDQRRLHPVAGFGKVADELETAFWRNVDDPQPIIDRHPLRA